MINLIINLVTDGQNDGDQCDDILVSSYNGDSDLEDGHVGIWKKVGRLGKVPKK